MNEKDVKKYIFRLQKNGREKLLHCIMISRKDPMKALQEAEKEAVNKGIILESYTDIPVEILKSCGIVPMNDSFEEVVVGDYPNGNLFEKYGFAVACCEYCRNFCEGICTYHCEEEAADNVCNYTSEKAMLSGDFVHIFSKSVVFLISGYFLAKVSNNFAT